MDAYGIGQALPAYANDERISRCRNPLLLLTLPDRLRFLFLLFSLFLQRVPAFLMLFASALIFFTLVAHFGLFSS